MEINKKEIKKEMSKNEMADTIIELYKQNKVGKELIRIWKEAQTMVLTDAQIKSIETACQNIMDEANKEIENADSKEQVQETK